MHNKSDIPVGYLFRIWHIERVHLVLDPARVTGGFASVRGRVAHSLFRRTLSIESGVLWSAMENISCVALGRAADSEWKGFRVLKKLTKLQHSIEKTLRKSSAFIAVGCVLLNGTCSWRVIGKVF